MYDAEVAEVRVPKTLRGIIGARVARLESTERYLLQVLSVLGRASSGSLIVRIAGETMERGGKALRSLEEQGFLTRDGKIDFRFTHALMADVIRDGLPRESLRAMHLGVAQSLEALYPAMIAEMAERLAYHYRRAGERVASVRYWELAATRCSDENAFDPAIRNLENAIDLVHKGPQPDNAQLLDLYQRATTLCVRASKAAKGLMLAQSAFELAEALGKRDCIARFSIIQGQLLGADNRFREAERWMERGLKLATTLGDLAMRREGTVALSQLYSRNGEYRRAANTLTEALEMVMQARDREAEFTCRLHLAVAYAGGRQEELCLAQLAVAAELASASDDPLLTVALYKNETVIGLFLEDEARTLRIGEQGLKLAKEYHLVHDQAAIAHNMGESYLNLGDFKRGFSHLKFSHDLAVENGLRRLEYINLRLLGYIDVVRFQSLEGREKVREALSYAKDAGLTWDYLQCMQTMGQVEQALQNDDEARRYFREVIRLAGEHGNRQYEQEARTALTELMAKN